MPEKLNIYQKLQKCRVELLKMDLKKTGRNEFSNYDYFELGDFLPQTQELFYQHGLIGLVAPGEKAATLTVRDTDKPEDIIMFYCNNAEISLKGAHSIQNIGAVKTYQRRYLWIDAMEISEKDAVDRSEGKTEKSRTVELTYEEAAKMVITFGKHNGMTLLNIFDKHPDYVSWYMDKGTDESIKAAFAVIDKHLHDGLDFETLADADKINSIKSMLVKTDSPESEFLKFYKLDRIEDMTIDTYVRAMRALEKKLEKMDRSEPDLPI